MKRIFLLAAITFVAASCTGVTPEQRIQKINTHFQKKGNVFLEEMRAVSPDMRMDFITVKLMNSLDADEVWTVEDGCGGESLVADFKGRRKDVHYSVISACLEDNDACATVLDVLNALKNTGTRPGFTIRTVFYSCGDSTGTAGLKTVFRDFERSMELTTFDIEVSSVRGVEECCFVIEDKPIFVEGVTQLMPPYFEPVGNFKFVGGDFPNPEWPTNVPTYRYRLGSDPKKDAAAISVLAFLLN